MKKFLLLATAFVFFLLRSQDINAQSCIPTNLNNTVITIACGASCTNLSFKVPHLKSTSTYTITTIPYNPFPYLVATGGTEDPVLYADDEYSGLYALPFSFCFYDSTYANAVIGSNGLITFDETNANKKNAYPITQQIPYAGGSQNVISPAYYPKAAIMGAYSDLDPRSANSPPDVKIQWRVEGTAPCRKFVVSYYHVGTFGADACTFGTTTPPSTPSPTTFQMVMYESTGLIDVYILNKSCTPSTNGGNAILGVQNWARDQAVAAPGKNGTNWTSSNEGYRIIPSGGASKFISAQLLDMSGVVVATGDTATTVAGLLDINFPNICPTLTSTQYVVKTTFSACPTNVNMVSLDTITINRSNALTLSGTMTPTTCGASTGTVTVTPTGGVAPYQYSADGGALQSSNILTGLAVGPHSIYAVDAGGCNNTITITVTSISSLPATVTAVTGTTCPGINNGSITIQPTAGTAPYSYSLDGGPSQASNIFTGVAAGSHTITFTDANACSGSVTTTVAAGTAIQSTAVTVATSCPGVNSGSTTITPTSGSGPYTFSIDGGPFVASGVFTGLAAGSHTITIRDVNGCTGTKTVTVSAGAGIASTQTNTFASCPGVNNGTITITPTNGVGPYTYSVNGGAFQPSNVITGLAPGTYTVTIRDNTGCQGTKTVTIISGTAIAGTSSSTNVSCPGANNGSITVIPVTGTAPYTFTMDGGPSQASPLFAPVPAGLHNMVLTDVNGCSASVPVTITAGPGISGTASSTATSCPGVNNGTVTVTPTSGAAPYTYAIDGGATQLSNIFTNVSAGNHTMSFTDAGGCSATATVTVAAGTAITGTATSTSTSCPGVSNGTASVTSVSGAGPYTYSIDGGTSQASNTFNGLSAGAHTLGFTNGAGCTGTVPVTVTAGAAISGTATSTATSCPGVNNGTASVTSVSGAGPYTYSIDGGPSQPSNTFNGLSAGAHTLGFTNGAGCTGTVPVTVASGAAISGTASSTATSCPGVNNGTATVTSVGGAGPYTYSIDGGPSQPSSTFNGLTSGPHTLGFTNGAGCTGTVPVTVTAGAAITGTASSTATSCPGVNNGTATVTSVGGAGPYTYSIDGGPSQPLNTFTGLTSGVHTIGFTNGSGCTGTIPVTVAQGAPLTGTATSTNTSCPTVNNGTVTAVPSSGGAPYQYSINGGTTYQASATFTGLSPNTYTITIKDNAGCTGTVSATVAAGSNIASAIVAVNPPCANINDGTITINPSTGTAPFKYSLNGGPLQLSNIFTGLAPGTYTIAISDALGCTGTNSVTLTTNSPLATTVSMTMPLCNGNANGIITLTASGGIAPYQYSINAGGTYQASGTFNGLSAGIHTIRIKDNVGCIKDTTVTLNQPPVLTASATSTIATCAGNDGVITITAGGGTTSYQYSIDGTTYQNNNVITAPATGPYNNIKVKDANGCTTVTNTTVTYTDNVVLDAGPDSTICAGQSIILRPVVNPQVNIFRWTPNVAIDNPAIKNPTVTPLDTTKYYVTATWGPCIHTDSLTIFVKKKPVANAGPNVTICQNDSTVLTGTATNLSGTVNFVWTPPATVRDDSSYTTIVVPPSTQIYTLTVTDNYGCNFSVTDDVTVTVRPPVPAFAGNDTIAIFGVPHQLTATGGTQYVWSPSTNLSSPFSPNPLATLTSDTKFTVIVTDIAGCIGYDTVFVKVYEGPTYYTPNAFTPNSDGLNDVFRAIPVGISKTDYFRIFNRYGQLVFETNEWLKGWDGTFRGKKQPIGVYVWIIKGTDKSGANVEMKGTVMLIQ